MRASNSREEGADLESIYLSIYLYEAGLPALMKTIAAKNSNLQLFLAWQEERGDPDD